MSSSAPRTKSLLFYLAVSAYVISACAYVFWEHTESEQIILGNVDKRLLITASNIKYILEPDFHDRAQNKDSISKEEDSQNILALSQHADEIQVKFLYTVVRKDGHLYLTSSSATEQERVEMKEVRYFEPYDEAVADLSKAFDSTEPTYLTLTDRWGTYRTVAIPERSPGGVRYLACADYSIDYVDALLSKRTERALWIASIFLLVSLPLFGLYRRMEHEHAKDLKSVNALLLEDIERREQVEKSLASERHLLNGLMDTITDHIYFKDRQSRFIRINKALSELFRLPSPQDAVGKTDFDIFTGEHAQQAYDDEQRIMETGEPMEAFEEKETWADREVTWASSTKVPILGPDGKTVGLVGISRDITDQKKAEQSLRFSNERLRFIAQVSSIVVGKTSLAEQAADLARRVREVFKADLCVIRVLENDCLNLLASNGSIDTDLSYSIDPNNGIANEILTQRRALAISDVRSDPLTAPIRGSDPSLLLFVSYAGAPLLMEDRVLGIIAVFTAQEVHQFTEVDLEHLQIVANNVAVAISNERLYKELTNQKDQLLREIADRERAESSLRESEKRYRELVEGTDNLVIQVDGKFHIVFTNPTIQRILGKTSEELTQVMVLDLIYSDDREKAGQTLEDLIKNKASGVTYEHRLLDSAGRIRHVAWTANLHYADDGSLNAINAIGQDITERKNAEEEKRNLEAQVQHAQKLESLGILAGGIAHDFNNLLMGILGNTDLAIDDTPENSPVRIYLEGIIKATKRASELTRQMLAYSGKGRFIIEPIHLNELVEEMSRLLEVSISKKHVLRHTFADDLPAVMGDATQIRQVIMNLITNASEAIGDNIGVISISTGAISCDRGYLRETYLDEELPEGLYVTLEVADTGCGMDKALVEKIFDPFFTTKFMGRGLGLAATLGIVRGHRGALRVYSEPGKGTTFRILLPALGRSMQLPSETSSTEADWRGEGTILLVDDEETVRTLCKKMLERMGFSVLIAVDGIEALDMFRERQKEITCVLLDLTMPNMDGEETFRELRRIKEDLRVILSSGYSEQDVLDRFSGKGISGFIEKPYRYAKLAHCLKRILS